MLKLALILTTLLAATSAAAQPGRTGETCSLAPAIASDFPDPSILYDPALNGEVFAYATNIATASGGLLNVPVSRSVDPRLKQWSAPTDALPRLPGWARGSYTWAPAVAHRPGEPYRLYFTARYGFSGRPCIGVAVSQDPTGPFTPTNETKPLVCPLGEGGAIDPSIFKEEDGSEYLLWKTDSNCCEGVPTLYIQKLAPDGLSLVGPNSAEAPWLMPDATPLIHADQPWEGRVIEAPTLLKQEGRYDLFYSGGDYASSRYAVGYASAVSLFGPYQKAAGPILSSSTSGLQGPGGQDLFAGPDGETWIAFHAWQGPPRYRALYFGQIVWTGGSPNAALQCADPAPAPPPH